MQITAVLYISLLITKACANIWIDPHDMNTNAKEHLQKTMDLKHTIQHSDSGTCSCSKEKLGDDILLVFLKRIIGLIINFVILDPTTDIRKNHVMITETEYEVLNEFFTKNEIAQEDLQKLDTVMSSVFARRATDLMLEGLLSAQEKILAFMLNHDTLVLLGIVLCVYITVNLIRAKYTFKEIICYFILMIFIVDYGFRYKNLKENADEHNMKIQYTSKCDTNKMSWRDWWNWSEEKCGKKMVSPLEVLLQQCKQLIIIPGTAIGTAVGGFASQMWKQLPFPWNIVIFPVLLLFTLFLVAVVLTITNGQSFKINLMHLFHIEFGSKNRRNSSLSRSAITNLLEDLRPKLGLEDKVQNGHHTELLIPALENPQVSKKGKKNRKTPKKSEDSSKLEKQQISEKENIVGNKQVVKNEKGNNSNTESKKVEHKGDCQINKDKNESSIVT